MNQATENLLLVLSAPGLYCLMVLLGRWLKRKKGVRLGWLYHLFSLALAVYLPASILEVNWAFMPHLAAATFLLGCVFLMALMDRYLWEWYFRDRNHGEVPKFLTEVARLAILIIAIFLVLEFGYHQSIRGLLVAPGIAVIIIGLAMQDSVGNIIAGLTLQMGRPFEHGDWLLVDSRHGDSMFILVEGEANVVVDRNGVQAHVASLASGDCFGEMSLLTGERRSATVVANSDCEVVEIGKSILAAKLKENPELLAKLSEMLARRQLETDGILAAHAQTSVLKAKQTEYQASFLDKLRKCFEL
jgi:hypothetical protein